MLMVLVVLAVFHLQMGRVQSRCLCTVKKNGEYCGTELNELNDKNDCPKKMYFCGDTNRDKEAVMLVNCPEKKECDVKSFCMYNPNSALRGKGSRFFDNFYIFVFSGQSMFEKSRLCLSQGTENRLHLLWNIAQGQGLQSHHHFQVSLFRCHLPSQSTGCLPVRVHEWDVLDGAGSSRATGGQDEHHNTGPTSHHGHSLSQSPFVRVD